MSAIVMLKRTSIGLVLLATGCAYEGTDSFFVTNASMREMETHAIIREATRQGNVIETSHEFLVTGHRISAGSGSVIALREYSPSSRLYTDQESFRKVTLYLHTDVLSENTEIDFLEHNTAFAFVSNGTSAFAGMSGCFGYAERGTVTTEKKSEDQILVDLSLTFSLTSPLNWQRECDDFVLRTTMELTRKELRALTPWEGAIGNHIYDESFRN